MFMLGILGTGHCIGMCGPLVFAFPSRSGKVLPHFFYRLGRTFTYVAIGAIGAIGAGLSGIAAATGNDPIVGIGHVKVGPRLLAALSRGFWLQERVRPSLSVASRGRLIF